MFAAQPLSQTRAILVAGPRSLIALHLAAENSVHCRVACAYHPLFQRRFPAVQRVAQLAAAEQQAADGHACLIHDELDERDAA